jgi:hypothetical protein
MSIMSPQFLGRSFLADPMEAVGGDLGETPPRFEAARILAAIAVT